MTTTNPEPTDIELRIAIAEACGLKPWMECGRHGEVAAERIIVSRKGNKYCPWCGDDLRQRELPPYPTSLDAMHEAAMWLKSAFPAKYAKYLFQLRKIAHPEPEDAPARQRALAFVATIKPQEKE